MFVEFLILLYGLFQIRPIELRNFVERNDIQLVIEIAMARSRDDHQLFVIAFELLEGGLSKVAAMCFLAVDD